MKHSLTNRALGVGGDSNTTSVTVRLPDEVVAFIDSHFTGRIKNRSEFLQHWAQVGVRVSEDDELDEALDWALERNVFGRHEYDWPAGVTVVPQSYDAVEFGVSDNGLVSVAETHWRAEPDDTVAEVVAPEPVQKDEVTALRESQLEALRSRVH